MAVAIAVAVATNRTLRASMRPEQLDGENYAAQRCVESGGDAGAGASGDESHPVRGWHRDDLAERCAERLTDLNNGATATAPITGTSATATPNGLGGVCTLAS